jgi:DNA-binding MarR family transcriptional regulator
VGFFAELCEGARRLQGEDARWWTTPVEIQVEEIAERGLLSLNQAETALSDLERAGLLTQLERGHRIEADVLCECPALASFDLGAARERLHSEGHLVGPATAVLREIIRLADARSVATTTLDRLAEASLYGRTRVTQALGSLVELGLINRVDLPSRMVRLDLLDARQPAVSPSPPRAPARRAPGAAAPGRMRLPTNVPLQIGGVGVELVPGVVPELEIGSDGRYYVWLGPVRLGPYDG